MKTYRFWIISLLLLAGCALPLQRAPQEAPESESAPASEQANQEPDQKQAQRSLAGENSVDESIAESVVVEDSATSGTASRADGESVEAASAEAASDATEASSTDQASATVAPLPTQTVAASAASADSADALLAFELVRLDLGAEGRTFLEAIDTTRRELGQISAHHFVEITDTRGVLWQGEALTGDVQTVLLLQPLQAGGQTAVQISLDSSIGIESDSFRAALAQILAEVDVDLPDPESFGLPDAEILMVKARETSPGLWNFDVQLNHPDTGWEDYTDGWHVEAVGEGARHGQILGVRILLHPHVGEMPFTRGQGGIAVPADVATVQLRSHDLVSGYGQETVIVPIGESGSGEQYEVIK